MSSENVCRLCLITDVPMRSIVDSSIQDIYEKLTNSSLISLNKPLVACYICCSQLKKCHKLMARSVRAEQLLTQILECGLTVNPETIAMLDRKEYKLDNSLSISLIEIAEFMVPGCKDKQIKEEPMIYTNNAEIETEWIHLEKIKHEKPYEDFPDKELGESINIVNDGVVYNEDEGCGIDGYVIEDSVDVEDVKNELTVGGVETGDSISNNLQHKETQNTKCKRGKRREKPIESDKEPRTEPKRKTRKKNREKKESERASTESNCLDTDIGKESKDKFICKHCNIVFDANSDLMEHIEHHNIEGKYFECPTCNRKYRDKHKLLQHSKIHIKRFECTVCNKKFGIKCNLDRHLRTHTKEKRFQCTVCTRQCFTQSHLDQHMIIHTGKKPFKCKICNSRFNRKNNLVTHMNEHNGEKPFSCNVCKKSFKRKGNLNEHLRVHTGEKPYKCDVCSSSFSHKHSLKKHVQTHVAE